MVLVPACQSSSGGDGGGSATTAPSVTLSAKDGFNFTTATVESEMMKMDLRFGANLGGDPAFIIETRMRLVDEGEIALSQATAVPAGTTNDKATPVKGHVYVLKVWSAHQDDDIAKAPDAAILVTAVSADTLTFSYRLL